MSWGNLSAISFSLLGLSTHPFTVCSLSCCRCCSVTCSAHTVIPICSIFPLSIPWFLLFSPPFLSPCFCLFTYLFLFFLSREYSSKKYLSHLQVLYSNVNADVACTLRCRNEEAEKWEPPLPLLLLMVLLNAWASGLAVSFLCNVQMSICLSHQHFVFTQVRLKPCMNNCPVTALYKLGLM